MDQLPVWMKQEGNKIIFNGSGELIYYIPDKYFEMNAAIIEGEYILSLGIFCYAVFDKDGKSHGIKNFKFPMMIKCKPSKIEKLARFKLQKSHTERDYRLLHFSKGDELICDVNIAQDMNTIDKCVNLFKGGHFPDYIPYNEIQDYFIENAKLNGLSYKVSNQIIGLIVSEIYRDPKDLSKPFRNSKFTDYTDYTAININKVPKYTSIYTAITSENPDEAIAAALTNTGEGESPLEQIVME